MAVAFYISGHGFGHASREVEVINALAALGVGPIVLRTSVAPDFLARTVRAEYVLEEGPCDAGILQATSLSHDDPGTVSAALAFDARYRDLLDGEPRRL